MKKRKNQRARVVATVLLVLSLCLSARWMAVSIQAEVERLRIQIEYHVQEENSDHQWPFDDPDPWLK